MNYSGVVSCETGLLRNGIRGAGVFGVSRRTGRLQQTMQPNVRRSTLGTPAFAQMGFSERPLDTGHTLQEEGRRWGTHPAGVPGVPGSARVASLRERTPWVNASPWGTGGRGAGPALGLRAGPRVRVLAGADDDYRAAAVTLIAEWGREAWWGYCLGGRGEGAEVVKRRTFGCMTCCSRPVRRFTTPVPLNPEGPSQKIQAGSRQGSSLSRSAPDLLASRTLR
jgi:hypothetical protein